MAEEFHRLKTKVPPFGFDSVIFWQLYDELRDREHKMKKGEFEVLASYLE